MEWLTLQWLAKFCILPAATLAIGFLIGSRRSHRSERRLERDLNRQHLLTLDANAELLSRERQDERCERLERVVKMALGKLQRVEGNTVTHQRELAALQNQHRVEVASLSVEIARFRERSRAATALARQATSHLKRLEGKLPVSQTISAPAPKSYGQGEPVQVSIVDQEAPGTVIEPVSRVSNRDSAVLTRLHSSNDESRLRADNLQAISGIDTQTEQDLNAAGIHRVEQLAELTEVELAELRKSVGRVNGHDHSSDWVGGARELMQEQAPAS